MRLAWRIAAGPKRAPGRFEVPRSNGIPATQIAASVLARSTPRNVGRTANVGTEVILSGEATTGWKGRSHPFEHCGDALADADAHRHQRIAPAGALQLTRGGQRDARARGAERVTDGDGPAVHIDPA